MYSVIYSAKTIRTSFSTSFRRLQPFLKILRILNPSNTTCLDAQYQNWWIQRNTDKTQSNGVIAKDQANGTKVGSQAEGQVLESDEIASNEEGAVGFSASAADNMTPLQIHTPI